MKRIITDYEEWRTGVEDFYEVRLLDPEQTFVAECTVFQASSLVLTRSRFPSTRFHHDPARMSAINNEYLLLQRYFEGEERGALDDVATHAGPHNIHIIDMSRKYVAISRDAFVDAAIIPHSAVNFTPGRDPSYASVSLDSSSGRLLSLAFSTLMVEMESQQEDTEALCSVFCNLIQTLMLKQELGEEALPTTIGREALIRRFINLNLGDCDLSVQMICQEFSISRSALYRLFEEQGGIARYISDSRLDRCLTDLAGAQGSRGIIRRTAEKWGFFEAGNFTRSFRERFGVKPVDCVGIGLAAANDLNSELTPLQMWMRTPHAVQETHLGQIDNEQRDAAT